MEAKAIILCVSVCFVDVTLGQCFGREPGLPGFPSPFPRPFDGPSSFEGFGSWLPNTCGGTNPLISSTGLAASYGGGLSVTSSSPISPTGLSVTSENAIEGNVIVSGQMPFLGAVATDGAFETNGAGAVSYGCGDGNVGIIAELPIAPAVTSLTPGLGYSTSGPYGFGPSLPGFKGLGGCGSLY